MPRPTDPARPAASLCTKQFPSEFRSRREVLFFPAPPDRFSAHTLEIGPGRGDYLFAQATLHPDRVFAAIEIGKKRYFKLIHRVQCRGLGNVILINGDARLVVPRLIPESSLQQVVILFPDPWPKRRHTFHRLLTSEFLEQLARCLVPGGGLLVRSDVMDYVDEIAGNIAATATLEIESRSSRRPDEIVSGGATLYEQVQSAAGCTIHTLLARRVAVT
ncbi:MAG: hypothetical protein HY304_01925 [candidate division Zixibacteria bacterium]|nr:hypothetical protein [candidate division Zixibacteria bacterium]